MNQNNTKNKLVEPWRKLAESWDNQGAPGRPSRNEITVYRNACNKALKGKKKAKVLVMGATPEIRDLLSKFKNAQVIIIDITIEMIIAMTSLMKNKNEHEIWIRSDWILAPLPENYFDLILADWTATNLPFKKQEKYYYNISKWLKNSGLCAERVLGFRKEESPTTMQKLNSYYEGKRIDNNLISSFWATGVFYMDPPVKREVRVNIFKKRLDKFVKNNPNSISAKILTKGGNLYPPNKMWFVKSELGLRAGIEKSLNIIDEFYDPNFNTPDLYKKMGVIYYMTKK